MAKQIVRNTHGEAVVKVYGAASTTETINLATDLLNTGLILDGATQTVSITGVTWTGGADGIVTISRNSVATMTLQANAAGMLLFDGQTMPPDTTNSTFNIVVAISGAACECWLKLRKVSGYKTTIEPATFGSYDDPAVAGS